MKTNKLWFWALLGAFLIGLSGCVVEPDHDHYRGGGYYDYGHGYGYDHQYWDHEHDHDWR
ncbi:MAG TPA: hypothetical protein VFB72_09785 [Verrucomicrobiae bacterium]|nr:hypothetical protein [Verrucomicrobiae bacterium]